MAEAQPKTALADAIQLKLYQAASQSMIPKRILEKRFDAAVSSNNIEIFRLTQTGDPMHSFATTRSLS